MKHTAALASATIAALAQAETPSHEQLASYGLTLPQYGLIKASESPYDFDHTEQEQLWLDAAEFAYEAAASHATDSGITSLSYMPYVVCNESPGSSGQQRLEEITNLFSNTPGVGVSDYYEIDTALTNGVNATCVLMRAYNDTMASVYGQNPGAEEWLVVQPMHQSMKMNNMTVDIIRKRFDNIESGDYAMPNQPNDWFKYVNVLGSQALLCPGVKNFGGEEVPDDEIEAAVENFMIEDNGNHVKDASFFHKIVNGESGGASTDRMTMWTDIISDVDAMAMDNGTNYCREAVIQDNLTFKMDNDVILVSAKYSTDIMSKDAEKYGFGLDDLEKCMLYLSMGLALNPMLCSVEPRTEVKVYCPDGNSDLSTCPEPGTGNPESSSFKLDGTLGAVVSTFSVILGFWSCYS